MTVQNNLSIEDEVLVSNIPPDVFGQKMRSWDAWKQTQNALTLGLAVILSKSNFATVASNDERMLAELSHRMIEDIKHHALTGLQIINVANVDPELMNFIQQTSSRTEIEIEEVSKTDLHIANITRIVNELSQLVKLFGIIRR